MATYSASDANGELAAMLHGTSLNKIQNLSGLHYRTARSIMADVDPIETVRVAPVGAPVRDVYEYPVPVDLKGDGILDIFPAGERTTMDIYHNRYNASFDEAKMYYTAARPYTIVWNNGEKRIRIDDDSHESLLVNNFDAITGTGTWSSLSNVSYLLADTVDYTEGSGSLAVTASATNAVIQNTGMTAVDLSSYVNIGTWYLNVWLPSAILDATITLRWGSDASNVYQVTASQTAYNTAFKQGWNLVKFTWNGATIAGAPDPASTSYVRVGFDSATSTYPLTVKYDGLFIGNGRELYMSYYSEYMYRNATTGTFQEKITSLDYSELINLDTDSFNLYVYKLAQLAAHQSIPMNPSFDVQYFDKEYNDALEKYKASTKSQTKRPSSTYYPVQKQRYWGNRGFYS